MSDTKPQKYRYEPGHLYEWIPERQAYLHCLNCSPQLTEKQAIAEYEERESEQVATYIPVEFKLDDY